MRIKVLRERRGQKREIETCGTTLSQTWCAVMRLSSARTDLELICLLDIWIRSESSNSLWMLSPRPPFRQCYCYYYYSPRLFSDQLTGAHLGPKQLDLNGHQWRLPAPNHQGDTRCGVNEPLSASVLFSVFFSLSSFSTSPGYHLTVNGIERLFFHLIPPSLFSPNVQQHTTWISDSPARLFFPVTGYHGNAKWRAEYGRVWEGKELGGHILSN